MPKFELKDQERVALLWDDDDQELDIVFLGGRAQMYC